jgi:hypothetical protein
VIVVRVIASAVAAVVVGRTLMSAVRTFVVPRDRSTALTRVVFLTLRKPFVAVAKRRDAAGSHRVMRLFAPMALLTLPAVWLFVTWICFATFFWSFDDISVRSALEISGSSVTTLGAFHPATFAETLLSFVEAALGISLVALLITYLPTIYAAYQRREREVALLSVRAGSPPSPVEMLVRFRVIGLLDDSAELWADWEAWFVDLGESHTSMGSLAQFRSGPHEHSWITAAGAVLDGAALTLAALDVEWQPRGALCLRSGYLALREVADFYDIAYDPAPAPDDPISITREEFDDALARLDAAGVPLKHDRDQAWRDFSGWRVNYDTVLLALCGLVGAPAALWSGDRATGFKRPPVTRRGGRGRSLR